MGCALLKIVRVSAPQSLVHRLTLGLLLVASLAIPAAAQEGIMAPAGFADRFALIGQVAPRHARDIAASDWSIGAEGMDRDFTDYEAWRDYLGPSGVKRARIQSGWAKTEKRPGRYDFAWLDRIVDDMNAQGVAPWISLSYGNPIHPGGGTANRDSPLPSGAAREAWLNYVRALVRRYRTKVRDWEIWNEPDHQGEAITAADYAQFAFETARVVRAERADARIVLGAFTGGVLPATDAPVESVRRPAYAQSVLRDFTRLAGPGFAHAVTYHGYAINPDNIYPSVARFRALVAGVDPSLAVWQGENGAPSLNQQLFAMRNGWWTEELQAKWLLRRMLGDRARNIPTSSYGMAEMHYPAAVESSARFATAASQRSATWSKNSKGLLETRRFAPGTPDDDRRVLRPKMGYRALQNITSIFDATLRPVVADCRVLDDPDSYAVHAFAREDGARALAVWRKSHPPGERPLHSEVTLRCADLGFAEAPHYVDLLTGGVYRTTGVATAEGTGFTATAVPVADTPALLIDPRLVAIQ
jgi:hypothetical protein